MQGEIFGSIAMHDSERENEGQAGTHLGALLLRYFQHPTHRTVRCWSQQTPHLLGYKQYVLHGRMLQRRMQAVDMP